MAVPASHAGLSAGDRPQAGASAPTPADALILALGLKDRETLPEWLASPAFGRGYSRPA